MKKIEEFYDYICSFNYGWSDKNGNVYEKITKDYLNDFILRSKEEVIKSKRGVCWELVELEREFFENNNIQYKTLFVHHNDDNHFCHTFSVFTLNNKYYWFEGVLKGKKGIFEFDTLDELLQNVIDNFKYINLGREYDKEKIEFYNYKKPKTGFSCLEFFNHCFNSEKL